MKSKIAIAMIAFFIGDFSAVVRMRHKLPKVIDEIWANRESELEELRLKAEIYDSIVSGDIKTEEGFQRAVTLFQLMGVIVED